MSDLFFRAFVGPRWMPNNHDWITFNFGDADVLDYATTLNSTLFSTATSEMQVVDGVAFAAPAGVWVGPVGEDQAWEYIEYVSKSIQPTYTAFNTLTREPSANREHNGIHTVGATVLQWMPVDTDNGSLRIVRELEDTLCAATWYAELAGVRFPQRCLRNDHAVVVQQASLPGGPWTNLLVGWLDSPSVADTWEKKSEWRVRIMCVAGIIGNTQARGVRVGDWDIAREATASSSPVVPAPWKEFGSSGFDSTLRSYEAEHVVDGRSDTLWIAEEMIGTRNAPSDSGYAGIEQLHINPVPSIGAKGNCWLAITNVDTLGSNQLIVYAPSVNNSFVFVDLPPTDVQHEEYVIVCENETAFRAQNPTARPKAIVEVEDGSTVGIFRRFEAAGGCCALKHSGLGAGFTSVLCWGTVTSPPDDGTFDGADWDGPSIAAPARGQTMRRIHNLTDAEGNPLANEAENWETSYRQSPGYLIDHDYDVWIKLDMPGMEIELAADIDMAVTTLPLRWGDTPSTDGLPSSGTVVIDEEEIVYTGKTATTLTGCTRHQHGTAAVEHLAGTKVWVMQEFGNDSDDGPSGGPGLDMSGPVATDGYPQKSTSWYMENGSIVPRDYRMYFSPRTGARNEDEGHALYDYPKRRERSSSTVAAQSFTHSPPLHIKTMMLEAAGMSENPARCRLTRIESLVERSYFDAAYWMSAGATVEDTLDRLAQNTGLSSLATTVTGGGQVLSGHTTAAEGAWAVLVDLADYGGSYIAIALDSKIAFRPNLLWTTPVGSFAPSYTWAAVDLMRVEKMWGRGGAVSQIKLNWNLPSGVEQEAVLYPDTQGVPAAVTGRIEEVGPYIYPNAAAAGLAARKRYYLSRYPYTALAQLAVGDLSISPGAVVGLTWQFDEEMQPIDRLYLTKAVEHVIEGGALVTTCNLIEIDREAA
jgi:hypothetical protein